MWFRFLAVFSLAQFLVFPTAVFAEAQDAASDPESPEDVYLTDRGNNRVLVLTHGGEIVAQGTPEEVAAVDASYTGHYLRPMLDRARGAAE